MIVYFSYPQQIESLFVELILPAKITFYKIKLTNF